MKRKGIIFVFIFVFVTKIDLVWTQYVRNREDGLRRRFRSLRETKSRHFKAASNTTDSDYCDR